MEKVRGGKRKAREEEVEKERARLEESGLGMERITQRMVSFVYPLPPFSSPLLHRFIFNGINQLEAGG